MCRPGHRSTPAQPYKHPQLWKDFCFQLDWQVPEPSWALPHAVHIPWGPTRSWQAHSLLFRQAQLDMEQKAYGA